MTGCGLGSLFAKIRLSNSPVRLELRRAIRRFCLMIETSVALELAHHMWPTPDLCRKIFSSLLACAGSYGSYGCSDPRSDWGSVPAACTSSCRFSSSLFGEAGRFIMASLSSFAPVWIARVIAEKLLYPCQDYEAWNWKWCCTRSPELVFLSWGIDARRTDLARNEDLSGFLCLWVRPGTRSCPQTGLVYSWLLKIYEELWRHDLLMFMRMFIYHMNPYDGFWSIG